MARAATASIDFSALLHNYRLAKQACQQQKALAIIKADAYGHSAVQAAFALQNDADGFGVACIEEALELRENAINLPILLLEGFFNVDELPLISDQNLWTTIHSRQQIEQLKNTPLKKSISVWLKMDTGMHRLGIPPEDYARAYDDLKNIAWVKDIVLMSHFASADELSNISTEAQINTFKQYSNGIECPYSLANSAATFAHENSHAHWQRPGIMLYGASPFAESHPLADQLKPVMTLSSEIIAIHNLHAGDAVGYGGTYVCKQSTKVGIVAMGYADGYPRHAKTGTPVMVNGQRTQLIGCVSMDMLAVDLTHIDDADTGSYVELWGPNLLATEVAKHSDTIAYTLFTGITRRVYKQYLSCESLRTASTA